MSKRSVNHSLLLSSGVCQAGGKDKKMKQREDRTHFSSRSSMSMAMNQTTQTKEYSENEKQETQISVFSGLLGIKIIL